MNIEQYRAMKAQEESAKEQPKNTEVETKQESDVNTESASNVKAEENNESEKKESTPSKVKVGEDELELDELIKGYMRQSDYTKKTQEVSTKRKEIQEAIDVYEKIKSNPDLKKAVEQGGAMITDEEKLKLMEERASIELEKELLRLSRKYSDFNEVKVITEAARLGIDDLEFVYSALKGQNNSDKVDTDKLREELRKELLAELEGNKDIPSIIDGKRGDVPTEDNKPKLSPAEKKIAKSFKMSESEYLEYKLNTNKR